MIHIAPLARLPTSGLDRLPVAATSERPTVDSERTADDTQYARVSRSLTTMPPPTSAGWAHTGDSASVYRLTSSNALELLRETTSSPSVVIAITSGPAVRNAAFSASRPFVVHMVLPVARSRQKNCPRLRFVSPKRYPPDSTGVLMYIGRSGFCHAGETCHFPAATLTRAAVVGLLSPA